MINDHAFSWRSVALPAFLPTLLFSLGEGAVIPIIPVVADSLGATLAVAGLISAMITVGELVGDIPSGWLVARIGERTSMIGAALVAMLGLGMATIAPNPAVLGVAILLIGVATAVFSLARHAFMTSYVPLKYRARALSTLGGTFRLGFFVGPFIAAGVIHFTGRTSAVFIVHVIGCLGAATVLLVLKDPGATFVGRTHSSTNGGTSRGAGPASVGGSQSPGREFVDQESRGLFATLARNRGVLARLGTGAALIGGIRASRAAILPLWAVSIGMNVTTTALIIGVAGAVDFALFYASGQIMDRFGRLWSAVPSMVGLGSGLIVLALTAPLPGRETWFIVVAIVLSVANGIGSGILMTLGADLADPGNPAPFLGAWRFTADLGGAGAPVLVALITAVSSLALATGAIGVLGIVGAGILLRYVPRYAPHRR